MSQRVAIASLLALVFCSAVAAVRFYLKRRREAKPWNVPADVASQEQNLEVAMRKLRSPILREERVYVDVLPFVRVWQGFWLVGALFFVLTLVNKYSTGSVVMDGWVPLGTNLIKLFVFTAVFLCVSVAMCRMSKPFGFIALWASVAALFLLLPPLLIRAFLILKMFLGGPISQYVTMEYLLSVGALIYLHYFGIRASWRFAFSESETRRIVSEIDPNSSVLSGWISKVLAMPIPMKHLRKNRALTTTLFVVSGAAFSSFAVLAVISVARIVGMFEILVGKDPGITSPSSPFVHAGIAIGALLIALAARAGARRLMISSIAESQEYDARPPILFLRSFRDEQVELPRQRLPFLGRLLNVFQAKGNLDIVLLEEGTAYGPVVAVGDPGEPIPPYGASRGYFTDGDWRKAVAKLADESRCIVICLDETAGVMWELDTILKSVSWRKTLFLMKPGAREPYNNNSVMQKVMGRMRENMPIELLLSFPFPVIGFFFDEGVHAKIGISREFSEASYVLMVRWFLRTAMDGQMQPN